jgi:hypothetical protein
MPFGSGDAPADVGVDATVLLVMHDVEQALLPEQALEVEVVRLLVEERRAEHALDEWAELRLGLHRKSELARDGSRHGPFHR